MDDIAVGIDLGTTNSLIGAVINGRVQMFADAGGNDLLPSVVGAGASGEVIVGRAAKNRRLLDPEGTVVSVKRTIGSEMRHRVGTRELTPTQVSALIVGALLDRAEAGLRGRPARAVITVPANFDDAQRQATRDAGQIAGLVVERLLNEPTAAALTYHTGAEQLVMVYDLGGGTFDVSILERTEGLLEVRTSHGDRRLGGDDVDQALVRLVLDRLGAKSAAGIEADPRAMTRLVEAVERAKIALSDREEVRLFDPFIAGEGADAAHLDMALTREDVEAVSRPLIERTLACVDAAMRDARVRPRDLDRVLLVGGASKMPVVRSMVAVHMGRPAQLDLDADRAVAVGASLLAGRLSGAALADVLVDITPHTLAVGVFDVGLAEDEDDDGADEDDKYLAAEPVIPRGTVVPVERKKVVFTMSEDQPAAQLPITQGEERQLDRNTRLGEVFIEDLPPSPAHSPVEVTFRVDLSGVLDVSAVHLPSGKSASVSIANSPYQLTGQQRRAAQAEVEEMRAARSSASEGAGLAPVSTENEGPGGGSSATSSELSLADAMLARARSAVERADISPTARDKVNTAAGALARAVSTRAASVAALTDNLSDALLDLM
jgi:molecular chaperone DnaK